MPPVSSADAALKTSGNANAAATMKETRMVADNPSNGLESPIPAPVTIARRPPAREGAQRSGAHDLSECGYRTAERDFTRPYVVPMKPPICRFQSWA